MNKVTDFDDKWNKIIASYEPYRIEEHYYGL